MCTPFKRTFIACEFSIKDASTSCTLRLHESVLKLRFYIRESRLPTSLRQSASFDDLRRKRIQAPVADTFVTQEFFAYSIHVDGVLLGSPEVKSVKFNLHG